MKTLDKKYRDNELNSNELSELKKEINSMNDSEIEELVLESWEKEDFNCSLVKDSKIQSIKSSIDNNISIQSKKSTFKGYKVFLQIASIVLLPILLCLTIYYHNIDASILDNQMFVSTGTNERVTITLPDQSRITISSNSNLSYNPKSFNKKEREITFEGEGFFEITKQKDVPFFINGSDVQVKVLGTKFNFSNRDYNTISELSLEEGRVQFTSLLTGLNVLLEPNQIGIINKETGTIDIVNTLDITDAAAWKRNEIVMRDLEFDNVIRKIEEIYNVEIIIDCKNSQLDAFTGTLSTNNIDNTFEILEAVYNVKIIIKDRQKYIVTDY